jgi:hypothetical protein
MHKHPTLCTSQPHVPLCTCCVCVAFPAVLVRDARKLNRLLKTFAEYKKLIEILSVPSSGSVAGQVLECSARVGMGTYWYHTHTHTSMCLCMCRDIHICISTYICLYLWTHNMSAIAVSCKCYTTEHLFLRLSFCLLVGKLFQNVESMVSMKN